MFTYSRSKSAPSAPKKGICAEVLIDGVSPRPPRDVFHLEFRFRPVMDYLLSRERGFRRIIQVAQFPPPEFLMLASRPRGIDQYRLAFGLTLLQDALEAEARMGLRIRLSDRSASRIIESAVPASCIRLLEVLERVDELRVRFWYPDPATGGKAGGTALI